MNLEKYIDGKLKKEIKGRGKEKRDIKYLKKYFK